MAEGFEALKICAGCGTQIAPALLACPACRRLVHADELQRLAGEAQQAAAARDLATAMLRWRMALPLLPVNSKQHAAVLAQIDTLSREVDRLPAAQRQATAASSPIVPPLPTASSSNAISTSGQTATPPLPPTATAPPNPAEAKKPKSWIGVAGGVLFAAAMLLWKLKAVVVLLLSKAKFLIMGLTKLPTSLSMLAAFWVYWQLFGWQFAAGLVVSIYIHEMGHVFALQRYGIPATAPMFIPGLGAFIRSKHYPHSPRETARVGLAGPVAGLLAAVTAYAVYLATRAPIWGAIAQTGAVINLFNLIPVLGLDGSHGFKAMHRWQQWVCVGVVALMSFVTGEGMLVLIGIVAAIRATTAKPTSEPDRLSFFGYIGLIVSLSLMAKLHVDIAALTRS